MKTFTYIIIALSVVLIGFNIRMLDFDHILEGNSLIALIGIIGILCAVVILLIFRLSKSIDEKLKKQG